MVMTTKKEAWMSSPTALVMKARVTGSLLFTKPMIFWMKRGISTERENMRVSMI